MAQLGKDYKLEKPIEEMVLYSKPEPNIAIVTLNRPEKHNAMIPAAFHEICRKVRKGNEDDEVKVIILKGNGPSFCAGDDLNQAPYETFGGAPGVKPHQSSRINGIRNLFEDWKNDVMLSPKVLIAQIHGNVTGAGATFFMACDLSIAGESLRLRRAEQRIGFGGFSLNAIMWLLTIGPRRERELLLTGRSVYAQEAKEWGLVNAVVPDDNLDAETMRWAKAVALNAADGLTIGKYYRWMTLSAMGTDTLHVGYMFAHSLFQNTKWREGELNFLKERITAGSVGNAFKVRDDMWAELGFK